MEDKPMVPKPTVMEKATEKVEALKAQIATLKAKNKELQDKLAFQVTRLKVEAKELRERVENTKVFIAGKSVYVKSKDFIARVQILPKKQILCFQYGEELIYLHGYILENKRAGYLTVREAQLVDYDLFEDKYFVKRPSSAPYIPRERVQFVIDSPM